MRRPRRNGIELRSEIRFTLRDGFVLGFGFGFWCVAWGLIVWAGLVLVGLAAGVVLS